MASAARSLRLACHSCRNQRPIRHVGPKVFMAWKSVGGGAFKEAKLSDNEDASSTTPFDHWEKEMQEHDEKYKGKTPTQIMTELLSSKDREKFLPLIQDVAKDNDQFNKDLAEAYSSTLTIRRPEKIKKDSFWDEEEHDPDLVTNDEEEFAEDDITDIGHAKLEEHREQRAYARTAIWEMPLLAQYAKPFEPPSIEQPLRFRYTSYMGEFHPAEKKVVVEFCASDFGLTPVEEDKLKKLVGPRYNPETEIIKMSCESFEHQAQNKRHLGDLVQKLVAEAKDPTDDFSDIPLDIRHHKITPKPKFPIEWRLSEKRKEEIIEYRQQAQRIDASKEKSGKLIDGVQIIQKALNPPRREKVPEMSTIQSQFFGRPAARHGPPRF